MPRTQNPTRDSTGSFLAFTLRQVPWLRAGFWVGMANETHPLTTAFQVNLVEHRSGHQEMLTELVG